MLAVQTVVAVLVHHDGGWANAERDLTVTTAAGVVVVLAWVSVEATRRVRAARGV